MVYRICRGVPWRTMVRPYRAFVLQRCLWGTDWTRAVKVVADRDGAEAFRVRDRHVHSIL